MLHEVSFASFNGRDQVQGWIYVPACKPKGIVQVIHGFGEHSRRYLHMISAFLDAGYIVAADDHVGHGKTAMVNEVWGDWGDKGPHTMMEDEHTLKGIVCEKYPDLPYFLFGHSMGSFITRDFMQAGNELLRRQANHKNRAPQAPMGVNNQQTMSFRHHLGLPQPQILPSQSGNQYQPRP